MQRIVQDIWKILANRVKNVTPKIISSLQRAFVQSRDIHDNIVVSSEIPSYFSKRRYKKEFIAIKLDMEWAYIILEWKFIYQSCFSKKWTKCIMQYSMTTSLSVLVNEFQDNHYASRGIRQGDSVSLYIFIICAEYLYRYVILWQILQNLESLNFQRMAK